LLLCKSCRERVREMDRFLAQLRATLADGDASSAVKTIFVDRRREERDPSREPVEVSRPEVGGPPLRGVSWDRSPGGLGVLTTVPLEVGERVVISAQTERYRCIVRFCYRRGSMYRVGLERLSPRS
jgi:hypothetical protein